MANETMHLINSIVNERLTLYRLSGKQRLTPEQQLRIQQIGDQLPILWDRYRREYATERGAAIRRNPSAERQPERIAA